MRKASSRGLNTFPWLLLPLAIFAGCGDINTSAEATESDLGYTVPTFEEFRTSLRRDSEQGYLVDGDIWLPNDETMAEYYEEAYLQERPKSIIDLVGGVRNKRPNGVWIRYCFTDKWGQAIDVDGDTVTDYNSPALAPTQSNIEDAMAQWEATANVRFVHMTNLDGAGCNNTGSNPGVDFVVRHYDDNGSGIATGAFPDYAWADQALRVPSVGLTSLSFAAHELGHVLGFRHEHIHSGSGLSGTYCSEGGTWEELTEFDTQSVMKYFNCAVSQGINGTPVSPLDGVGALTVYGIHASWYTVLL